MYKNIGLYHLRLRIEKYHIKSFKRFNTTSKNKKGE